CSFTARAGIAQGVRDGARLGKTLASGCCNAIILRRSNLHTLMTVRLPQPLMTIRPLVLCLSCLSLGGESVAAGVPAASVAAPAVQAASAPARTITGVVRDSTGAAISGALVSAQAGSRAEQQTVTASDGRFTLEVPASTEVVLTVRAGGFAEHQQRITAAGSQELAIVLMPARLLEEVTVTPARTEKRLGDVPASTSILSAEDIRTSPAVVADDVLRQVPTFSLFRRTSSLSSHPTAQGVSLRGIGPSGVSRTLVLLDNVPANDPFGGWVYWTRIPLESTNRIEVVDGSGSSLYGNYAMGGVVNIVTSRPAPRTIELRPQYGNLGSPKLDFFASDVWGKVGAAVEGSLFRTDGFPIVSATERGAVDDKAAVDFGNYTFKLDYTPSSRLAAFVRAGYFRENRDNGKHSTFDGTEESNDTRWKTVTGGVRAVLPDASDLQVRV